MGDFSVEEEEGVVGAGFDRSSLTGRKVGLALGMEVEGRGSPVVYFFFEREGGWERGRGRTDTSFFFFFWSQQGGLVSVFSFFFFLSLSLSLSLLPGSFQLLRICLHLHLHLHFAGGSVECGARGAGRRVCSAGWNVGKAWNTRGASTASP